MAEVLTQKSLRTSYAKKKAHDFRLQKEKMDMYDTWIGAYRNDSRIKGMGINYDLFNGRLDTTLYEDPLCLNIEGEQIQFDFTNVTHYPIISQVANAMHGEQISRPFQPVAKDLGSFGQTMRGKKINELLRELITTDVIIPLQEQISQEYIQQHGIQDVFMLTPEQVDQMRADITGRVQSRTSEEILQFMEDDFQTPTQRQAQQLLDYFVQHQDIRATQNEGFKHALCNAMEVYYVGERHEEPIFELVNLKGFSWGGSQNTEWIQDGTWAKYEQWFTIEDILQRHAEHFARKDLKYFDGLLEPLGGVPSAGDPTRDPVQQRVMLDFSTDEVLQQKYGHVDYKTKAGQRDIMGLYAEVMNRYGMDYGRGYSNYGVREAHIVWRDKRKMYRVTRNVGGRVQKYWFAEHYYEPSHSDIEVREVWVDWIWEGTKLGSTGIEDIYVKVRPLRGQYKSIFNPFGIKLPYVGKSYNTHMNNSKNVSIVDLGKPWQKEFDVMMAQIKHDMATDHGRVFLMSLGWKPENWTWQQWFDTMRNGKVLMTQLQKHGFGNIDPNLLRSIDLSKASDIANKLQMLEHIRGNLVRAMNFNDARTGAIGQYTTNQNIVQSQVASYNQTEAYFETHRQIVEKALNQFINTARILYKENNKRHFILDDVTRTELEISPDFWYEQWAVEMTTSSEDIRRIKELRAQMMSFVQNGMSFDGVLALALADTPSDIIEVMKREAKRAEEQRQEAMMNQNQQIQMRIQADKEEKEAERQLKVMLEAAKLQSQEKRALIDMDKFRLQNDVDRNNVADTIQKAILEMENKKEIEAAKLAMEKMKHDDKMRIEELELLIKNKQSNIDQMKAELDAIMKNRKFNIRENRVENDT